jgi:tripartite-type tricarboxylate transporter receptor subunit TctC
MMSRKLVAGLVLAAMAGVASAQNYPNKPIRVIVPFAPAGGVDLATRAVAEKMSAILKQPLIIDNRGGGGTVIATDLAARAEPDGYTIFAAPTTMVINPFIRSNLPYDWEKAFAPVSMLVTLPFVVSARKDFPANTMKDLARIARDKPGQISFASGGAGTVAHFAGELFAMRAGTTMIHVPYRGEGPAFADALGGQISVLFSTLVSASGHLKGGKLKALAVTSRKRSSLLPDIPTAAEQGYTDYDVYSWAALVVPKGTPPEIVKKLNEATNEAMKSKEVQERLIALGGEPGGGTAEELAKFMKQEEAKWSDVAKKANIQLD